jgi:hypothetical protein
MDFIPSVGMNAWGTDLKHQQLLMLLT